MNFDERGYVIKNDDGTPYVMGKEGDEFWTPVLGPRGENSRDFRRCVKDEYHLKYFSGKFFLTSDTSHIEQIRYWEKMNLVLLPKGHACGNRNIFFRGLLQSVKGNSIGFTSEYHHALMCEPTIDLSVLEPEMYFDKRVLFTNGLARDSMDYTSKYTFSDEMLYRAISDQLIEESRPLPNMEIDCDQCEIVEEELLSQIIDIENPDPFLSVYEIDPCNPLTGVYSMWESLKIVGTALTDNDIGPRYYRMVLLQYFPLDDLIVTYPHRIFSSDLRNNLSSFVVLSQKWNVLHDQIWNFSTSLSPLMKIELDLSRVIGGQESSYGRFYFIVGSYVRRLMSRVKFKVYPKLSLKPAYCGFETSNRILNFRTQPIDLDRLQYSSRYELHRVSRVPSDAHMLVLNYIVEGVSEGFWKSLRLVVVQDSMSSSESRRQILNHFISGSENSFNALVLTDITINTYTVLVIGGVVSLDLMLHDTRKDYDSDVYLITKAEGDYGFQSGIRVSYVWGIGECQSSRLNIN